MLAFFWIAVVWVAAVACLFIIAAVRVSGASKRKSRRSFKASPPHDRSSKRE
jgi:hypothetical protein